MPKFKTVIHYAGAYDFLIEADDEDAARQKAEEMFGELSAVDLEANIADVHICDCYETDEEDEDDT